MADWDVTDREYWGEKMREKVEEFGLSRYPQEFELCDHFHMLGYIAYSGLLIRSRVFTDGKRTLHRTCTKCRCPHHRSYGLTSDLWLQQRHPNCYTLS